MINERDKKDFVIQMTKAEENKIINHIQVLL